MSKINMWTEMMCNFSFCLMMLKVFVSLWPQLDVQVCKKKKHTEDYTIKIDWLFAREREKERWQDKENLMWIMVKTKMLFFAYPNKWGHHYIFITMTFLDIQTPKKKQRE